jgi:hypothetical protein
MGRPGWGAYFFPLPSQICQPDESKLLTRHRLASDAVATASPAGMQMLLAEALNGPDLIEVAFVRAFPQSSLYCDAKQNKDADPKSYKNCFNHNDGVN